MPTGISYVDETVNPWVGCKKIRAGCKNCYAERLAHRLACMGQVNYQLVLDGLVPDAYEWNGKIAYQMEQLEKLKHWRKPRRILMGSMTDIFYEKVPFDFIDQMMAVIYKSSALGHKHLILTKRPERMAEYFAGDVDGRVLHRMRSLGWAEKTALLTCSVARNPHLWLGISCSTQKDLDEMAPVLFRIPASHYWLSSEPLIEDLQMGRYIGGWDKNGHCKKCGLAKEEGVDNCDCPPGFGPKFSWVVVGAESGPNRRPCNVEWVRSIVRQCKDADVAVYVKQLDDPDYTIGGTVVSDPNDFPEDLRIRELP